MNKIKAFFSKVGNYIKNTAWIQPLLIVVIIFVVLFSLGPITNGIKSAWNSISTTNDMDKISYKEYIEKVNNANDDDKMIVVFSQKNCDICPSFYKSMNYYLKNTYNKGEFTIYNVDLSTKDSEVKINGTKYKVYKDTTLGLVSPLNNSKEDILAQDYARKLDERIQEFQRTAFEGVTSNDLTEVSDSTYTYVSTPLVIWYEGKLETRISNNFNGLVTMQADGKQATAVSFKKFIEDFGGDEESTHEADWHDPFDLTYSEYKNIKDAF